MNDQSGEAWDRGVPRKKKPCISLHRLAMALLAIQVKGISCDTCGAPPGQECTGFPAGIERVYPMLHWGRVCKYKDTDNGGAPAGFG